MNSIRTQKEFQELEQIVNSLDIDDDKKSLLCDKAYDAMVSLSKTLMVSYERKLNELKLNNIEESDEEFAERLKRVLENDNGLKEIIVNIVDSDIQKRIFDSEDSIDI